MAEISFKERVCQTVIALSKSYKSAFVDYQYLVCSDAFTRNPYYIIDANADNYGHLTGVNLCISPSEFFNQCYEGTLHESDFDFNKNRMSEKQVIGSVRRKIQVLSSSIDLFQENYENCVVEEAFIKNKIVCSFAAADSSCTLGFVNHPLSRPLTLLKGNLLDKTRAKPITLLMKKHNSENRFKKILIGDTYTINSCFSNIETLLDESILDICKTLSQTNKETASGIMSKETQSPKKQTHLFHIDP